MDQEFTGIASPNPFASNTLWKFVFLDFQIVLIDFLLQQTVIWIFDLIWFDYCTTIIIIVNFC